LADIRIHCEEIGYDCWFVAHGGTEEEVLDTLIRHMRSNHSTDWFELEEAYGAAREMIRREAA